VKKRERGCEPDMKTFEGRDREADGRSVFVFNRSTKYDTVKTIGQRRGGSRRRFPSSVSKRFVRKDTG